MSTSPTVNARHDPRPARQGDVSAISRTLAAAFLDDPVFAWTMPNPKRRREIELEFFSIIAEGLLPHGAVYTTDAFASAAIWAPPGIAGVDDELAAALGEAAGEYAEAMFQVFEAMDEAHPREPHHYLFFLATRPELQSRGIGSGLMSPVLDRCDRDRTPAYLEATSERNLRLYLRHGFEVAGEISLPDGPTIWPMWRDPA